MTEGNELQTPPGETISPETRRRLIEQFERWIDAVAAGMPPPEGLPDEILAELGQAETSANCDLYTLASAVTGLTGEVKLQGRAFKQLGDMLSPLGELPARMESLESSLAGDDEPTHLPSTKDVLGVLFDLQERMQRGLTAFDAALAARPVPGFLARLAGAATDDKPLLALREGYRLTLSRIEGALQQWNIRRIGRPGEMFDPQQMIAIEAVIDTAAEAGTIVEVFRGGYMLHDQVLATAQVKVARAPQSNGENNNG